MQKIKAAHDVKSSYGRGICARIAIFYPIHVHNKILAARSTPTPLHP